MKIEAEVHLFPSYVKGCSVPALELSPTAQERASIVCLPNNRAGLGCGSNENNAFDCEHFQFIDEDDESDDGCRPTTSSKDQETHSGREVNGGSKVNGSSNAVELRSSESCTDTIGTVNGGEQSLAEFRTSDDCGVKDGKVNGGGKTGEVCPAAGSGEIVHGNGKVNGKEKRVVDVRSSVNGKKSVDELKPKNGAREDKKLNGGYGVGVLPHVSSATEKNNNGNGKSHLCKVNDSTTTVHDDGKVNGKGKSDVHLRSPKNASESSNNIQNDGKLNGGGKSAIVEPRPSKNGAVKTAKVNGVSAVSKARPTENSASLSQVCPATDRNDTMTESVKRQVSFDDSMVEHPPCKCAETVKKELKSLLKRGGKSNSKRRVTFNEAVSLYSDEHDGVRLLQLTTGPDIICTDGYYMFEPPIEYQDVPPLEPPGEYRDDEDGTPTPPAEPADEVENSVPEKKPDEPSVTKVEENLNVQQEQQRKEEVVSSEEQVVVSSSETPKEIKTYGTDPSQVQTDSAKESDKLFERFLEAEREFAVDEELNNVFHELDSDFANDGDNGALDDNFFRKLITLLSSAEGDAPMDDSDFLSSTKFANPSAETCLDVEDDDNSQTHSRTLSEADSDCSISSQDTIIVKLGEEENEQHSNIVNSTQLDRPKDAEEPQQKSISVKKAILRIEKQESFDEVFNGEDPPPRPLPRESLVMKNMQMHQAAVVKMDKTSEESLSRQSSGEQSVTSGTSQDPPQGDADDSTSSDSRSGEVEEEMRLDDVGYDEEDAEDYDEESFRGMARGNSKIRRIIKKNALQCTLFKGIEAKRRQQPGAKYPRPKSPLLSQESLVEKLKWLTTVDDQKDNDPLNFHSKPPDVILSTGEIPMNGSIPQSEIDMHNRNAMAYQQQQFYQMQQRFAMPPNAKGGYYVRQDGYHASLPRQRMSCPGHPSQMSTHNLAYAPARMVAHPGNQQQPWNPEQQRNMTVPRNFRDWRVIQRVMAVGNRNSGDGSRSPQVNADYVRCANGTFSPPPNSQLPTDVTRVRVPKDELEQFVEQDSKRLDKLRRRYSLAEEDVDDPTFGFARRPSVRGIQTRVQSLSGPSDFQAIYEEGGQAANPRTAAYGPGPYPHWRGPAENPYGPARPMHIHRASVALTELPGCATIPYAHRKPHPDPRYHSYAESMYGSTRTLPTKGSWPSCHPNGPSPAVPAAMLQVPQQPSKGDERGVPEGASSSPKISSDSLYHAPEPSGPPQNKDEGVIYYSLNV